LIRDIQRRLKESCGRSADQVVILPPGWLLKTSSGKIARIANLQRWQRQHRPQM
jgi:hypothetical protein